MSSSSAGGHEMTGRVVRLHFRCHAALPIGSFLRVTGSTLWAPGTAAHDPTDAAPAIDRTEAAGFPTQHEDVDLSDGVIPVSALYTSSVEMVTTPEEYPVWRTRKPVVVVWHHAQKTVQHHYYRYLVVSPGGGVSEFNIMGGDADEMETDMDDYPTMVSTSNEGTGQTVVMQWEDPFNSLLSAETKESTMRSSAVSLTNSLAGGVVTKANYRNLPYRTIDIDSRSFNAEASKVKLDRWNMPDDATFRPYLIRDAVSEQQWWGYRRTTDENFFLFTCVYSMWQSLTFLMLLLFCCIGYFII
jgi:hypothetical protein